MANVQAIRQAIAAKLQSELGIKAYPNMPPTVNVPCIAVLPGSPYITYGVTMGEALDALGPVMGQENFSKNDISLVVMVLISMVVGYENMQPRLDALLEPPGNAGSIPDVFAKDETFGGAVDYAVVVNVSTYGVIDTANQQYFGARLAVRVGA